MSSKVACARVCLIAAIAAAGIANAGMIINFTYDPSVSADEQAAFNYAAAEFEAQYTNPIHINLNITTGTTGLGGSSTNLLGYLTYAQLKSVLASHATSANDLSSVAALGSTDPTAGGQFYVARAEAKALGLIADDASTDGTITFNRTYSYTTNPASRGTGGFDLIGIAEHEISETMGRIGGLNQSGFYTPFDLFRFTGAGTPSVSAGATNVYFSVNGGTTALAYFNSTAGGDLSDFNGTVATDPFNALTSSNQAHALNSADIATLDVIGYTLSSVNTPEPSTLLLFGTALSVLGLLRRRLGGGDRSHTHTHTGR